MSNRNNKGFSLVELMIAVAVMTLLISPIIAQVFQTVQTSARSKERQYVVDNANLVLEYFKANSIKDLSTVGEKGDAVTISSTPVTSTVVCKVYDESGDTGDTVSYEVTDYTLSNVNLGRDKNEYSRTVSMDNLSNKLMEKGYDIRYDVTSESTDAGDLSIWQDITSDGRAVKYDDNDHVNAILVEERTVPYIDPNESSLGNIQDINSTTMAIIKGNATEIDSQFQKSFVGNLIKIVTEHKSELVDDGTWDFYSNTDNLNAAFDTIRESESNSFRRMIKLTITAEDVIEDVPSYYNVKCEVYYKAMYTFLGSSFGSEDADNENFKYTVFDQKFYTDEAPDVYFVYEPFITKSTADYLAYSPSEYITIKGDLYTSGANGDDPSKVYLIKSDSTWAENVVNGRWKYKTDDEGNYLYDSKGRRITEPDLEASQTAKEADDYFNYFLTQSTGSDVPVNINITQIADSSISGALPIQVITNISYLKNEDEENKINKEYSSNYQFSTSIPDPSDNSVPDFRLSPDESIAFYPGGNEAPNKIADIVFPDGTTKKAITYPLDDKRVEGRLYSVTVRYNNLKRTTDATLYFTGAKGAD